MTSLIILIVLAISFYLYFKVKAVRTKAPYEKQWRNTKASISLGTFLAFMGINQIIQPRSTVEVVISIVFILLGILNITLGIKAYRYYTPLVIEEGKKTNDL
jgi:succinate-acetate transporter protein